MRVGADKVEWFNGLYGLNGLNGLNTLNGWREDTHKIAVGAHEERAGAIGNELAGLESLPRKQVRYIRGGSRCSIQRAGCYEGKEEHRG